MVAFILNFTNLNIMIEKEITKLLLGIEDALIDYKANGLCGYNYPPEAFRAMCLIFADIFSDKITQLQQEEGIDIEDGKIMASQAGIDLRNLVKIYTNIDTLKLYENYATESLSNGTK